MQFYLNLLYTFSIVYLGAISFWIVYRPSNILHYAHGASFVLGGYFLSSLYLGLGLPLFMSLLLSLLAVALIGSSFYSFFYKPLLSYDNNLSLLVCSLGLYIAIVACVAIFYGSGTTHLDETTTVVGIEVLGGYISSVQVISVCIAFFVLLLLKIFMSYSPYGLYFRAVADDSILSYIYGLPREKVIVTAYAFGSGLAGLVGILVGFDSGMRPTMGFSSLLYSVVAMIVGGGYSAGGVLCGAVLVSLLHNLVGFYFDTKWIDTATFFLLVCFLIAKPKGVFGVTLKKVEI
ncbi:branched-chain amino acid ABC transporter permease [Desulfovibrio sp. JC010]|uniref:branched-chain amino acid ABC transporter permease n=1 Tax=Desulfovibrio sp. JC010 TaxID=2593641 RepID=UPI0013D153FF|nr:branched-chain amino acid ABC transporter permease [Desulfovibrio sp. JC010]NDV26891.1 branched-chain amino acid ABC transporter permease [Desulfovibrio sp. JC010]